jgi:hypothetical protein
MQTLSLRYRGLRAANGRAAPAIWTPCTPPDRGQEASKTPQEHDTSAEVPPGHAPRHRRLGLGPPGASEHPSRHGYGLHDPASSAMGSESEQRTKGV